MTISSAVPAHIAERMQDEMNEKSEKVEERWWDIASENVWDEWVTRNELDVLIACLVDHLYSRPLTVNNAISDLEEGFACDAGDIWHRAYQKYKEDFLDRHRDWIQEECHTLEDADE